MLGPFTRLYGLALTGSTAYRRMCCLACHAMAWHENSTAGWGMHWPCHFIQRVSAARHCISRDLGTCYFAWRNCWLLKANWNNKAVTCAAVMAGWLGLQQNAGIPRRTIPAVSAGSNVPKRDCYSGPREVWSCSYKASKTNPFRPISCLHRLQPELQHHRGIEWGV